MVNLCMHLQNLLKDVYVASYGAQQGQNVKFVLRATPRVEITNVDDLVKLLEVGVVSFTDAMLLSNMLLGVDLKQGTGKAPSAGQFSRAFVTPSHKKDLIVAANAAQRAKDKPASSTARK